MRGDSNFAVNLEPNSLVTPSQIPIFCLKIPPQDHLEGLQIPGCLAKISERPRLRLLDGSRGLWTDLLGFEDPAKCKTGLNLSCLKSKI